MITEPARLVAVACRCQMLIGSFEGNDLACPCKSPKDCLLDDKQLIAMKNHPIVEEAIEKSKHQFSLMTSQVGVQNAAQIDTCRCSDTEPR